MKKVITTIFSVAVICVTLGAVQTNAQLEDSVNTINTFKEKVSLMTYEQKVQMMDKMEKDGIGVQSMQDVVYPDKATDLDYRKLCVLREQTDMVNKNDFNNQEVMQKNNQAQEGSKIAYENKQNGGRLTYNLSR